MTLYNNAQNELFYWISSPGSADCGTIAPGDSTDLTYYDNKADVKVAFTVNTTTPEPAPFSVTIPDSGIGQAVTIGLYLE